MLISETTRTIVQLGSLVIGTGGSIAALRHLQRFSRKIPTATARGKRSLASRIVGLLAIAGLPLGIGAYVWASLHNIDVLVVRDGHSVHGDRAFERVLGSSPLAFAVAPGNQESDALIGKPCWTVNGSSKPIRLVRIDYPSAYAHYRETQSVTVLPGQRVSDCDFDYYGPDFAPPATPQSMANARWNFATWLTWDDR